MHLGSTSAGMFQSDDLRQRASLSNFHFSTVLNITIILVSASIAVRFSPQMDLISIFAGMFGLTIEAASRFSYIFSCNIPKISLTFDSYISSIIRATFIFTLSIISSVKSCRAPTQTSPPPPSPPVLRNTPIAPVLSQKNAQSPPDRIIQRTKIGQTFTRDELLSKQNATPCVLQSSPRTPHPKPPLPVAPPLTKQRCAKAATPQQNHQNQSKYQKPSQTPKPQTSRSRKQSQAEVAYPEISPTYTSPHLLLGAKQSDQAVVLRRDVFLCEGILALGKAESLSWNRNLVHRFGDFALDGMGCWGFESWDLSAGWTSHLFCRLFTFAVLWD